MASLEAESFEDATKIALKYFPNVSKLKEGQRQCLKDLLKRRDVLGLLPTGYGKSLIFQIFPKIFELLYHRTCNVVVVSALQAITEEQILDFTSVGISAAALGESNEVNQKISDEQVKVVFGSAELWMQKDLLAKMKAFKLFKKRDFLSSGYWNTNLNKTMTITMDNFFASAK